MLCRMEGRMKKGGGRVKGSKFELDLAKDIAKAIGIKYGSDVRRTPNSGALTTRSDLTIAPKHFAKFPFFLEAKHREGWDFWQFFGTSDWLPIQWYEEAKEKLGVDPYYDPMTTTTILVFKQNGKKPLVMMNYNEFIIWFPDPLGYPLMSVYGAMNIYTIVPWSVFLAKVTKGVKNE